MLSLRRAINYYKSQNIFSKLISLIIVVILIPVSMGFFLSIESMKNLVTKQIIEDSDNSLQFIKHDIEELFTRTASTILYISDEDTFIDLLELHSRDNHRIDEKLNNVQGIRYIEDIVLKVTYGRIPFQANITIMSPKGVLYSTEFGIEDNITGEGSFETYLGDLDKDKQGAVTEYIIWKNDVDVNDVTKTKVTALKAINRNNKTIGIIKITLTNNILKETISKASEGMVRYILDENMNIISCTSNGLQSSSILSYSNDLSQKAEGVFITKDNKEKEIVTYKKVYNTKWTLVEVRPYEQILTGYVSRAYLQLFILVITTIVFIILSAFAIRTITNPIKLLSQTMLEQDLNQDIQSISPISSNEIKVLENSYSIMLKNMKDLMVHNIEIEKKKRNAELKALQSQIKPHFLFNTLSVIRFSILNQKGDKAEKMIMLLIKLLDATIFRNEELIPLSDEIENTKNYVEIIKLRQGIELELYIHIRKELWAYKVPRLILQPVVENSIIHGLAYSKAGTISILAYEKEDKLLISIADNGCGFEMDQGKEGEVIKKLQFSGVGIKNIDERIKIQYGETFGVDVESQLEVGTTVNIVLPKE